MSTVWRLNIKSNSAEDVDPRKFCFDKGALREGPGRSWGPRTTLALDVIGLTSRVRLKYLGRGFLALVFMIGTLAGMAGGSARAAGGSAR